MNGRAVTKICVLVKHNMHGSKSEAEQPSTNIPIVTELMAQSRDSTCL